MTPLIRSIATNINALAGAHFCVPRRKAQLRLRLAMVNSSLQQRELPTTTFEGYTCDISATGIAILLPIARLTDQLVNHGPSTLRIVLELGTGAIEADAALVRYEPVQVNDGPCEVGCLIGAQILTMRAEDRQRFEEHLRSIN